MKKTISSACHKILTFGYGNRKNYDQFWYYLQSHQVAYVIDVRLHPRAWSRRWYGDKISEFCQSKGIHYLSHPTLGNLSGKASWVPPNPEEARKTLGEIQELAREGTVLFLCAELDPKRCHRVEVAHRLCERIHHEVIHLD